jgi:hypothetical protein
MELLGGKFGEYILHGILGITVHFPGAYDEQADVEKYGQYCHQGGY